ncbi:hypothetical protein [Vibrio taketomensis]|uniref:hypothetical protein n=1 Tax=Vibrio taketomensis TaxID=2572923 RepID=UPI00138A5DAD|nr:hypothetical protein [Vibrio taketomensis]
MLQELDGVETPHKCLYNTLNIEFSMPHGDYYQFVSKLFSIPYIGQFALYLKPDAEEWVLLIPLDNCISYTHWRKLTDWLCDELAIQNKWSAHCLSPCPTEGNGRLHHTISENLAFLFLL